MSLLLADSLGSAAPGVASSSSSPVSSPLLSAHQLMESSVIDLMQCVMEYQRSRAHRRMEAEERRRKQAQAAAAHAATTAQLADAAQLTRGVYGLHARSAAAAAAPPQPQPPTPTSTIDTHPSPAAIAESFSSFLSHFHLLSHLVPQLPIASIERLIQFLHPTPIENEAAAGGADANALGSVSNSGTMPYAFPLLDASAQVQLIELLIKAYLQLAYLRDREEQDQQDEAYDRDSEQRARQMAHAAAPFEIDEKQTHREGEPGPGEADIAARELTRSPTPVDSHASRTPSASALCQLQLLRVLRAYAGHYRLSYVIHRCVDYSNWLACAVAMESAAPVISSSSDSPSDSCIRHRAPINSLLLASGSVPDLHLGSVGDAMECRLKYMGQRLEKWNEWKHRRARYPADSSTGPPSANSALPILLTHQLPSLPPDVWLSFDEYAVETAHLFMQLVATHLIRVATVPEQARLIALVRRAHIDT